MAKKQALDAKAKQKRQKIIAAVGGVLLLGILAFEIPNTMKLMKQTSGQQSSSQTVATTTTTASATPAAAGTPPADGSLTPPTLAGSATASTPASPGGLVNSDPAPTTQDGQLVKFDRFLAKDPFNQQVALEGGSSGSSSSTTSTANTTTGGGSAVPPGGTTTGPTTGPTSTTPAPTPPPANPTKATISVNGVPEDVEAGHTFPASAPQPYFKLVSLGANSVKIGIAGGSLASGDPTVTLVKGKKLTLMNTADGTRYELQLVALS